MSFELYTGAFGRKEGKPNRNRVIKDDIILHMFEQALGIESW
jgi:hypothetical protein